MLDRVLHHLLTKLLRHLLFKKPLMKNKNKNIDIIKLFQLCEEFSLEIKLNRFMYRKRISCSYFFLFELEYLDYISGTSFSTDD